MSTAEISATPMCVSDTNVTIATAEDVGVPMCVGETTSVCIEAGLETTAGAAASTTAADVTIEATAGAETTTTTVADVTIEATAGAATTTTTAADVTTEATTGAATTTTVAYVTAEVVDQTKTLPSDNCQLCGQKRTVDGADGAGDTTEADTTGETCNAAKRVHHDDDADVAGRSKEPPAMLKEIAELLDSPLEVVLCTIEEVGWEISATICKNANEAGIYDPKISDIMSRAALDANFEADDDDADDDDEEEDEEDGDDEDNDEEDDDEWPVELRIRRADMLLTSFDKEEQMLAMVRDVEGDPASKGSIMYKVFKGITKAYRAATSGRFDLEVVKDLESGLCDMCVSAKTTDRLTKIVGYEDFSSSQLNKVVGLVADLGKCLVPPYQVDVTKLTM